MRVTAEAKAATRERILAVAQRLFAENGYDATTTRDIAQAAEIATGTLFNYFPTKEAIVTCLASDAVSTAQQEFECHAAEAAEEAGEAASLEAALFAYVAAGLRRLKPLRKHLTPVLETTLCPLATASSSEAGESLRVQHLERMAQLVTAHGFAEAMSPVALQLYWTLYTGVLAFWANDKSPKQEDTLALLDQSLEMFVGWLEKL